METKKIVITGGAGFVASHIVEHFLKNTDWDIIVIDKLNYASNGMDRLREIKAFDENRVKMFVVDLQQPITIGVASEIGSVDYILNLASESHVDRSINDPVGFIENNVKLMLNMLEWAKVLKGLKKFIQFSTDEVYSVAPKGTDYKEGDRHNPGNPYSASKSAQEAICRAYSNTYGVPIVITNSANIIGERQHPEKFVPLCIRKILNGETMKIHSNPEQTEAGSRFYLHARNIAQALHFILEKTDEKLHNIDASLGCWNIIADDEVNNLDMALKIAKIMGKELKYELENFHASRPGHDLRYSLDGSKLKNAGFKYPVSLEDSLRHVVEWTLKSENSKWL